jgi:ATP adenylyltransferase
MRILDKNRASYKRTFSDNGKCVFCGKDEILECLGLAGEYWRVLVNRFPYMDGNVLIVPIRHVEKIEDVNKIEWQEFGEILSKTQKVLGVIFKTESFNIGMNVGPESGASIPHLHWQVVPRKFKNVTVMNTFADLHLVTITPEETKKLIDEATENIL